MEILQEFLTARGFVSFSYSAYSWPARQLPIGQPSEVLHVCIDKPGEVLNTVLVRAKTILLPLEAVTGVSGQLNYLSRFSFVGS